MYIMLNLHYINYNTVTQAHVLYFHAAAPPIPRFFWVLCRLVFFVALILQQHSSTVLGDLPMYSAISFKVSVGIFSSKPKISSGVFTRVFTRISSDSFELEVDEASTSSNVCAMILNMNSINDALSDFAVLSLMS